MSGSTRTTDQPRQSTHSRNPHPPKPPWTPAWETDQINSPQLLALSLTWEAIARHPDSTISNWSDYSRPVQDALFRAVDFAVLFALSTAGVPDTWETAFQEAMDRYQGLSGARDEKAGKDTE